MHKEPQKNMKNKTKKKENNIRYNIIKKIRK